MVEATLSRTALISAIMNYNLHCTVLCRTKPLVQTAFLFAFLSALAGPVFGQTNPERSLRGKPVAEQSVATTLQQVAPASVTRPLNPMESLRAAKRIYVTSQSVLVGQSVIETKLRNRQEFQQLGLMITRDAREADLILEVKHDVLTKYVFTAVDPRTNIVVASGKLSSLGGTVGGKVAERFLKQLMRARA